MVLSGTQEIISFDAFWFTSRSPLTALGAVTEAVFEAFCVAFAEGFFVVDGVLDAAGFLVDDTLEPSGLLEGAGVLEVEGVFVVAAFFGMILPVLSTFLHALQIVSPVYPSDVVVAAFLFTTCVLKW